MQLQIRLFYWTLSAQDHHTHSLSGHVLVQYMTTVRATIVSA